MRASFDQTALGMAEFGADGRMVRVNQRFCELLGRTREEILSRTLGAFTPEEDRAIERQWFDRIVAGEVRTYSREKRYALPDGRHLWTVVTVSRVEPGPGQAPFFAAILEDITARRGAELEIAASRARLQRYAEVLTHAIENERARIAREIHDAVGQTLTSLKMDVAWLRRRLAKAPDEPERPAVLARLDDMSACIHDTIGVARRLASELRPALLDSLGLPAALRAYATDLTRRSGLPCECAAEDLPLAPAVATALYRITLEAGTNVVRHAEAGRVWIELRKRDGQAVLEIRDDGVGFTPGPGMEGGMGVLGITERAQLVGGTASIESRPGAGTRVTARVPLAEAHAP